MKYVFYIFIKAATVEVIINLFKKNIIFLY